MWWHSIPGPGNMVIDALARGNGIALRPRGKLAASGRVDRALLDDLLADPYYRRPPPKRRRPGAIRRRLRRAPEESGLPMPDLIATATVLTAATVAMEWACNRLPTDLIVSGGGVHNPQIMAHLAGFLPGIAISTSTDHGIDADARRPSPSPCWRTKHGARGRRTYLPRLAPGTR